MVETVRGRVEGQHGWVQIDDQRYDKDVIIHTDHRVTARETGASLSFRTEYFHTPLSEYELGFLQDERPEVVIVGAGFKCMMLLTPRAKDMLSHYEHHVVSTQRAMEMINEERRPFVAILHLTC